MLTVVAALALGWGPITHYSFACRELAPKQTLQECITSHPDMISGDDFPDAFYFDRFIEGSNCSGFAQFHDNSFATQMLLTAKTYVPKDPGSSSFNSTQFALGYASHMYADDVGFYSSAIAPKATYLNWLRAWTYMVAIDAATAASASATAIAVPELPSAGGDFIEAVAAQFKAKVDPTAPLISASQVMECAAAWQFTLRDKTSEALDTLEVTWRHQLVEFSPYSATDADEALEQLAPAKHCVSKAWQKYLALVYAPGAKPGEVDDQVLAYITQLYQQGECQPTKNGTGSSAAASTPVHHQKQLLSVGLLGAFPEVG